MITISSAKIKLLLIGDKFSGKDELINKIIKSRFQKQYKLRVGVDILTKDMEYKPGEFASLSICDTRGRHRYEFIRKTFYKIAEGAIIIFNLYMKNGLNEAAKEVQELRQSIGSNVPVLLVGYDLESNNDLEYAINVNEARDFAKRENLIYITTTKNTIVNFDKALTEFTRLIIRNKAEKLD